MTDPRFVTVGFIDEHEAVHELRITLDGVPAARERGWLVLDDQTCPTPAHVRTRPDATGYSGDDDDDGA